MSRSFNKRNVQMKTYPGIDYTFAPKSFWSDAGALSAILRNVKGKNRRKMIRDCWAARKLEALDSTLLKDELDYDIRQRLARIHPSFMGGEFLPSYGRTEVEIARISLQSTTSDVMSLRARPVSRASVTVSLMSTRPSSSFRSRKA